MKLRTLSELGDLAGKRVLLRADFNVPVVGRRIVDDTRIRLTLPIIDALRRVGARVVLVSHFKEGKPSDTLAPIAAHLRALGCPMVFFRERVGTASLAKRIERLRRGDVALLENIRRYPGEAADSRAFARALAQIGDVYVNEAFAVCHRLHASVATAPTLIPSAAGPLLEREVEALSRLIEDPASPFVALIGGAKISTKLRFIERLLGIADIVLLGGALANIFFAARGYGIGASFIEETSVAAAKIILRNAKRRNLFMPIDVAVGDPTGKRKGVRVVSIAPKADVICERPFAIFDIGPATMRAYSRQLRSAATIVWNGPMGMFERPPFHRGSIALARVIASRSSGRAFGVVGGGETLAVLNKTGMARYIDHVSLGGGAMLAFLAGEQLPGLIPLQQ